MVTTENDIKKAHRIGVARPGRPQQMVVKCSDLLREEIFGYTKNLKGKKNKDSEDYFVDPQLPEPRAASRKELNREIGRIKKRNAGIKDTTKHAKYKVKQGKLCK